MRPSCTLPLTLVTGPANAEKARVVLDGLVAVGDREPLLVVPTFADVRTYQRELAGRGVVFGAEVVTFRRLEGELARRARVRSRALGRLARERVAALAAAKATLRVLGPAAGTPGFTPALLRLVDELEESRVDPARWYAAVRAWGRAEPPRAAYAEDLGALYAGYRRELEALGRTDDALRVIAALDALATDPDRWRGTPVLVYGFDDLTRRQRAIVEVLALRCGADVTVSLPYEPGRNAFAGKARTYQELLALRPRIERVEAVAAHYALAARPVLHHLERNLFEEVPEGAPRVPLAPSGGGVARAAAEGPLGPPVLLLRGGGQRAELELVAAHVARLLRAGVAASEVAVVLRRPREHAALVERIFDEAGVPVALERRIPAGHTALGRGVVALLRCALLDATADDLLAYLRTPGLLHVPELADRLEEDCRKEGLLTAAEARERWQRDHFHLGAIDRVRAAHREGPSAVCARLAIEAQALFAGPFRHRAPVLSDGEAEDARVAATLRGTLRDLARLGQDAPQLVPRLDELARTLDELEVRIGAEPGPGRVTVADPLAIRARRVRALFVCALQEGTFPATPQPEPFLGEAERRALNAASGLRLEVGDDDPLGAERSLFYAAASRPTELLALSWHAADEDGDPSVRSPFVDDVLDLLEVDEGTVVQTRELGAAGFADRDLAPNARAAERAAVAASPAREPRPIAALRHPDVLAELAGRQTWSASALEAWAGCPVKWFTERLLRADALVPDPEPLVRGELAHRVLEEALRTLVADGGALTPEHLPQAKRLAFDALERLRGDHRLSANPERAAAALRRLEAEVVRYLDWAVTCGTAFRPDRFELTFGGPDDELGPVDLGDGLKLRGRIDRIDADPAGRAVVVDYKGASAPPYARWLADRRLQVALYLLALPHLTGQQPVAGLYQGLGTDDPRPRGLVSDEADLGDAAVRRDRVGDAEFDAVLADVLDAAREAVAGVRAGALEPRPDTCGWRGGGCSYPSICRSAR